MGLRELPNRRDYWNTTASKGFPPLNFGRFMEISFFEHFLQHMSWSAPNFSDRWSSVRDFFSGFNVRRVATVVPSDRLTVDESMSANRTRRTVKNHVPHGLPHQAKIERKPEGVGCKIRCVIDGRSTVMLQLELQESQEEMATKKYIRDGEKAGTAGVLRLVEPWFNSARTVYGDSAFGSVNTAVKLREHGLHFMGMVKQAHREFPKKYLKNLALPERSGESRYLATTKNDFPLIAAAWWDKNTKHLISTAGTNAVAPPHRRIRYRLQDDGTSQRFEKTAKTSAIPHEYFSFAQKIDVHNHRRQGILALERKISTRSWSFRLISTVLGMIMVDAYMMYLSERNIVDDGQSNVVPTLTFKEFVEFAGVDLATNSMYDGSLRGGRSRDPDGANVDAPPSDPVCALTHIKDFVETSNKKRKDVHRSCCVCHKHTEWCCRRCSNSNKVIALCNFTAKRDVPCFQRHLESVNAIPQ